MTAELKKDDLTKTFFKTFEIEPKYKDYRTKNGKEYECKNPNNRNIRLCYPQITDRILLELILIHSHMKNLPIYYYTVEKFKEAILEDFIENSEYFKHQVQELFKGE